MLSWREIQGWTEDIEPVYDHIARTCMPEATLVEVGVWCGRSVIMLAQLLKEYQKNLVTVYAVDTFTKTEGLTDEMKAFVDQYDLRALFEENVQRAGVADRIKILQGRSAACAERFINGELDAVFIDADHRYEAVYQDITAWYPKLKRSGIIAGHDYNDPEVARAVRECLPEAAGRGHCWLKVKDE